MYEHTVVGLVLLSQTTAMFPPSAGMLVERASLAVAILAPAVHTLVPQVVVVPVIGSPFTIANTALVKNPDEPTAMICGACALLGTAATSDAATPKDAANHLHFVIDTFLLRI
jgi:hypothetical protein